MTVATDDSTVIGPEDREYSIADAERIVMLTEAIDSYIPDTIDRTLMPTSEFQNFLLDIRNILNL